MKCGHDFIQALRILKSGGIDVVTVNKLPNSDISAISITDASNIGKNQASVNIYYYFELNENNDLYNISLPVARTHTILSNIVNNETPKTKTKKGEEAAPFDPLDKVTIDVKWEDDNSFYLIYITNNNGGKLKRKVIYPPISERVTNNDRTPKIDKLIEHPLAISKKDIKELMMDFNSDYFELYLDEELNVANIRFLVTNNTAEYTEDTRAEYKHLTPIRFSTNIFNAISGMKNFELHITPLYNPEADNTIYILTLLTYIGDKVFVAFTYNLENILI